MNIEKLFLNASKNVNLMLHLKYLKIFIQMILLYLTKFIQIK